MSVGIHNFNSLNNLPTKDGVHPEGQHNVLFLISHFIKTTLDVNLTDGQFWNFNVTQKGCVHNKVTFCPGYVCETPTYNSGSSAHRTQDRGWPLIFKLLILKNEKKKKAVFQILSFLLQVLLRLNLHCGSPWIWFEGELHKILASWCSVAAGCLAFILFAPGMTLSRNMLRQFTCLSDLRPIINSALKIRHWI